MFRYILPSLLPGLCLVAGCWPGETNTQLVPDSPFGKPTNAPVPTRTSYTQAPTEVAARVDQVGRNLLAANPKVGVRPLFRTIGSPQAEVFHHGTTEINITEGLVKQCTTDGQLAAILALELGKVMSERETLASPWKRSQEREVPLDVPIRSDSGSDQTRLAELAQMEKDRRRSVGPPPLPPDPQALARTYLSNAGFPATDLDAVAPLLSKVSPNGTLEKQLTAPGPARPWTR